MASRRRFLTVGVGCCLAGCAGDPSGSPESTDRATRSRTRTPASSDGDGTRTTARPTDGEAEPPSNAESESPATTGADGTTTAERLDLREANVIGVDLDSTGSSYRFSVTLYHDDDGEEGYADWWQVETLDGEQLGRRTLLHAHSTAPFTRSETIAIPEGTSHVVVRGHDQTHGYGGQAMVVSVESEATEAVRQGSEPRDLSGFEPSDSGEA